MDFVDRIDELLRKKNLKRIAMCDDLGITHSAVTDWKRRGTIPAGDVCVRIAGYLGVDVEWLITGKEREKRPAPQERNELVENFSSLTQEQQEHILISIGVFQAQNGGRGKKAGA